MIPNYSFTLSGFKKEIFPSLRIAGRWCTVPSAACFSLKVFQNQRPCTAKSEELREKHKPNRGWTQLKIEAIYSK